MSGSVVRKGDREQVQLLKASEGDYTGALAHMLAENTAIDLHRACELKTRVLHRQHGIHDPLLSRTRGQAPVVREPRAVGGSPHSPGQSPRRRS